MMITEIPEIEEVLISGLKKTEELLLEQEEAKQRNLDRLSSKNMNNVEKPLVIACRIGWDRLDLVRLGEHVLRDLENKGA